MKRFAAIFAATVMLFVLVSPITPTPTAVVGANLHVHAPAASVTAVMVPLPAGLEYPTWATLAETVPRLASTDLLDLTCVRLC